MGGESELDELIRMQAEFNRSNAKPAAKCIRVAKPLPAQEVLGASEDGPQQEAIGRKRPASLFKQLRQGHLGGKPFGVPTTLSHPEIAALPELEGPEKDDLPCLAESVAERQPPICGGRADAPSGGESLSAPASGFPTPMHRSAGGGLGRARHPGPRDASATAPISEDEEAREIDEESNRVLNSVSPEEVYEWQQQLLQQFGRETCEFLKRRGQQKREQKSGCTSSEPAAAAVGRTAEQKELASASSAGLTDEKAECGEGPAKEAAPDFEGLGVELYPEAGDFAPCAMEPLEGARAVMGGMLDRHELQKLQWTMPAGQPDFDAVAKDDSLPPEPQGKIVQLLRFDLDGLICLRSSDDSQTGAGDADDHFQGLHHHGAESSQPGYTLAELLILSRSSSMPQRALAFRTLACVLERAWVPMRREELAGDPALALVGDCLGKDARLRPPSCGFGMGFSVFSGMASPAAICRSTWQRPLSTSPCLCAWRP